MNEKNEFYTLKGYQINEEQAITPAMEDYLEMIFRMSGSSQNVKPSEISRRLHVRPSSVTKMIKLLGEYGYVTSKKYGDVYLTDKGKEIGKYLMYRHETVHQFLCCLNDTENELEQAEKIEHFLDGRTVENMAEFLKARAEKS